MLSISQKISNVLVKFALSAPRTTEQRLSAFHTSHAFCCESKGDIAAEEDSDTPKSAPTTSDLKRLKNDRTQVIPVETSIRYLKSSAYKETYGDQLVWEPYRRNHKGLFPPQKTRKTCIRGGAISTGNPCPICRDEYLVLDYHNIELLKQFISPQSGQVLSYKKTGLCQRKHLQLLVAVEQAIDRGLISFDVPFREFEYSEYYSNSAKPKKAQA